jgi:hypothetical protein
MATKPKAASKPAAKPAGDSGPAASNIAEAVRMILRGQTKTEEGTAAALKLLGK